MFLVQLAGFRLQHGPLPEQYRFQSQPEGTRRHRHHKKGSSDSVTPSHDPAASTDFSLGPGTAGAGIAGSAVAPGDTHEKKPHKKKKNDDEKERKKKKKEKKKKKQRHSPEHVGVVSCPGDSTKLM